MPDCPELYCCPPSNWFDYSLNGYPVTFNSELTIFVPCPEGFVCEDGGTTIVIPAGSISYRPTNPEQNTPEFIEEEIQRQAEERARSLAYPSQNPQKFYYTNQAVVISCPDGQVGTNPGTPFFSGPGEVTIPPGTTTSTISLADANAKALVLANQILLGSSCHWENAQITLECDEGQVGGPVMIAAGDYTSLISQQDADDQAMAAAITLKATQCMDPSGSTPCDISQDDDTLIATAVNPNVTTTNDVTFGTTMGLGRYAIYYVSGAYSQLGEADNGTGDERKVWSANRISVYNNGSFQTSIPDITPPIEYEKNAGVTTPMGGDQAAVEALLAGVSSVEFFHRHNSVSIPDNEIFMRFTFLNQVPAYFQGIVTNTSGTPNPTYQLRRTRKFIEDQPDRVRIAGFGAIVWDLSGCVTCPAETVEPAFDGTFPLREVFAFNNMQWSPTVDTYKLGGKQIFYPGVFFAGSGLSSPTGCGWIFQMYCFDGVDFIKIAQWEKWTGLTPVGTYTIQGTPCFTPPSSIVLESY